MLKQHAQQFQIPISDYELWDLALTHISFSDLANSFSYERLEFLGDAVLDLCLAEFLFKEYPDLSEGKMSMIKSGLVNEKSLAEKGKDLQLLKIVKLGHGERLADYRAQDKVLCDLFESTLATIFLQHGLKKSFEFIKTLFGVMVTDAISEGIRDSKTKLQKVTVKVFKEYPTYEVVDTEGPDHGKTFIVKATVAGFEALGKGRSKKEAEQYAAQKILKKMRESTEEESFLMQELNSND